MTFQNRRAHGCNDGGIRPIDDPGMAQDSSCYLPLPPSCQPQRNVPAGLRARVTELDDNLKQKANALRTAVQRREKAAEEASAEVSLGIARARYLQKALEEANDKKLLLTDRAEDAETRASSSVRLVFTFYTTLFCVDRRCATRPSRSVERTERGGDDKLHTAVWRHALSRIPLPPRFELKGLPKTKRFFSRGMGADTIPQMTPSCVIDARRKIVHRTLRES